MTKAKVARTEGELRGIAKREAMKAINSTRDTGKKIKISDVAVVWQCWILGNWKAMITSTAKGVNTYYEFTYDKSKGKAYLDEYTETNKTVIAL